MKQLYFFIIPLLLQSCSLMYVPSVSSIPLLEEKGEFHGEAGMSTNSIYANAAYAFTNNFAASVSGNLSYENLPNSEQTYDFVHRYAEASLGTINVLHSERSKRPSLEIYGGMGMGRATANRYYYHKSYYYMDYTCNYYSFFAQGNFGLKRRIVEVGTSLRLVYSQFNYVVNENKKFPFQTNFGIFCAEPMGFVGVGVKNLKFVHRFGYSLPIYGSSSGEFNWTLLHASIGISCRIAGKTDKSKNNN